jgi:citronellol/citronellal dehydrogenase
VSDGEFDIAGAVAVVTGATRGIGRQVALLLGRAGARVMLVGRTQTDTPGQIFPGSLASVAAELTDEGVEVHVVAADVTDAEQTQNVVTETLDVFGRCDVLVNNAAYTSNGPIMQIPWSRWQKGMRAQVIAPLQLVQGFVPGMVERGSGRVVNVSSSAAGSLAPGHALYSVTKQAMERLNDYLDLEVGGQGVSFNALHIERMVATEGWQHVYDTQGEHVATLQGQVPMSQIVKPEELGRQIEWMIRQPAEWSGHIVTCGEVVRLGGPGTVLDD